MRAKSLSASVLGNAIKKWGLHCKNDPNYKWSKHDDNAMLLLDNEVKRRRHEIYLKRKAVKVNPYLDPKQPYHTT